MIEDVVTTGGALIAAVEALRAAGLVVERALCVLDREEGGNEALAALGVHLEPLFGRADLGMRGELTPRIRCKRRNPAVRTRLPRGAGSRAAGM